MSNYINTKEELDKVLKKIKDEDLVHRESSELKPNPYTHKNDLGSSLDIVRRFFFKKKNSTNTDDEICFVYAKRRDDIEGALFEASNANQYD